LIHRPSAHVQGLPQAPRAAATCKCNKRLRLLNQRHPCFHRHQLARLDTSFTPKIAERQILWNREINLCSIPLQKGTTKPEDN